MLCPSCHTENRENARFCKGCGRSLAVEQQPIGSTEPTATGTASQSQATPSAAPTTSATPAQVSEQVEPLATHEPATTNGNNAPVDDISLAPTQILTPQDMVAYHARRWQQEAENEATENGNVDSADQPTITASTDAINASSTSDEPSSVETDASPSVGTDVSRPSTDVSHSEAEAQGEHDEAEDEETHEEATPEESATVEDELVEETAAEPVEATAAESQPTEQVQPDSEGASPLLEIGTLLNGRYEVLQAVSSDESNEHEHVYQVVDHQGYQRCWNCGSEQNAEGDEFCIDCGAELLNIEYTMHEYYAASTNDDAHVLLGQIVNTFVEQGRTYVIEQPQISQPHFPNGVHLLVATDSDAGMVRRSDPNEDSTLVLQLQRIHESISSPVGVFIVADGMGGHDDGQGASRMTINVIAERITRTLLMEPLETEKADEPPKALTEDDLIDTFKGAIQDANLALCHDNQHNKTDKGSTVTGFMIVGDHAYIINVGDSRTYMLRDGKLYQLTNDHSLVSQLVASGLIEPDDIYTHPQRSQIFRSLGDKPNVQVDDFKQQLHPGDILLSCCDGLWEMVRNPQITEILANAPDPQTACTQLIEAANTNGGEDNISAVVVFVRE